VVRSLHNYEGLDNHKPVGEILVTGAEFEEESLVKALERRCNVPCCRVEPGSVTEIKPESAEYFAGSLTVIGLALAAQDETFGHSIFCNPNARPRQRTGSEPELLARRRSPLWFLVACGALLRTSSIGSKEKSPSSRLSATKRPRI